MHYCQIIASVLKVTQVFPKPNIFSSGSMNRSAVTVAKGRPPTLTHLYRLIPEERVGRTRERATPNSDLILYGRHFHLQLRA